MRSVELSLVLLLFSGAVDCQGQSPEAEAGAFEGDIVLPEWEEEMLEEGEASAGVASNHQHWTNATIPYEISKDYDSKQTRVIKEAMATISHHTCIRFVPHKSEISFLVFKDGLGCSSFVGRQPQMSGQTVTLEKRRCVTKGTVMHELIHAIGFWHEQSRPDRDDYVTVLEDNIEKDAKQNFMKHTTSLTFQLPYDYGSIMHYGDNYFGKKRWLFGWQLKTLKPKKSGVQIGQRERLTTYDILKIREMYRCDPPKAKVRTALRLKSRSSRKHFPKRVKKSFPSRPLPIQPVKSPASEKSNQE